MECHNKLFVKSMFLAECLGSSVIIRNQSSNKLCLYLRSSTAVKVKIWLHRILLVVLFFGGLWTPKENILQIDRFLFHLAVLISASTQFCAISVQKEAFSVCVYVNNILERKKHLVTAKYKTSFRAKFNILLAYIFYLSAFLLPLILVFGLHWNNLQKPSFIGYFLLPSNLEATKYSASGFVKVSSIFLQIGLFLVNFWFWSFGLSIVPLVGSVLMVLCTISFEHFLLR